MAAKFMQLDMKGKYPKWSGLIDTLEQLDCVKRVTMLGVLLCSGGL